MKEHVPPGITIAKSDNLEEWQMDIRVLDDNPLYQNQTYRLKFTFSSKYPIGASPPCPLFSVRATHNQRQTANTNRLVEPPEVQFIELPSSSDTPRPIPIHPHIYSNGIICLDLLSSAGWSPVQTVESVCMSIQSMLTANSRDERPPGDKDFVSYNRRRPRDINFYYDDDNV
jgi:ubiquitin-conjugating enzyme E2 W